MKFSEYVVKFNKTLNGIEPRIENRTYKNYLTAFATLPPLLKEAKKCPIKGEELRAEGNQEYANGNFDKAALLYTNSICESPPYSKCAALSYANRSAVSYHTKAYKDCILDIDRALNLPCPDNLRKKLRSRKKSAIAAELESLKNQTKEESIDNELEYAHGNNTKLADASNGIDISYTRKLERQLVAKKGFQIGDVLVIEKPYFTVPQIENQRNFCNNCLKKTFCLIPCDLCTNEVYCTEKCRSEAYQNYHRIECRIRHTLMFASPFNRQLMVGILRCLNIVSEQGKNLLAIREYFKDAELCSDPKKIGFTREQFIGNTKEAFLSTLLFNGKIPDLLKRGTNFLFEEIYVVILLRNYTDFFTHPKDVRYVAWLMYLLRTSYESNSVRIPYYGALDNKAYGCYPLIGMAGHSCFSNTITYHDNDGRIVLRASEPINPGDQIFSGYLQSKIELLEVTDNDQILQTKRHCLKCEIASMYSIKKMNLSKLNKDLFDKLMNNYYDVESLWKCLIILYKNKKDDAEISVKEIIKPLLVDAYEGRGRPMVGIV